MSGAFQPGDEVEFRVKLGPRRGQMQRGTVVRLTTHRLTGEALVVVGYVSPAGNQQQYPKAIDDLSLVKP